MERKYLIFYDVASADRLPSLQILHEVHRRYYEAEDDNKANAATAQGKGKQKGSLAKNNKVTDVSVGRHSTRGTDVG